MQGACILRLVYEYMANGNLREHIYIYGLLRTLYTRFKIVKTFETRADNIYMMGSNRCINSDFVCNYSVIGAGKDTPVLSWEQRLQIAVDAAQG